MRKSFYIGEDALLRLLPAAGASGALPFEADSSGIAKPGAREVKTNNKEACPVSGFASVSTCAARSGVVLSLGLSALWRAFLFNGGLVIPSSL